MEKKLAFAFMCVLALYMVLPWIMTRVFGIGVLRHGKGEKEVAFTFDDGPDPVYTPQLLELLGRHGIKGTFFVLGSKAQEHPELILRMHREGHLIGVHNYTHTSNWLMLPWTVQRRQVERSADIIESITGVRPVYYRPPWGIINLFDYLLRSKYTIVLWSVMVQDWRSKVGTKRMKSVLLNRIRDGSIVLLHDSGDTLGADQDAPGFMLEALEEVIGELGRQGYRYLRVDELAAGPSVVGFSKRLLVAAWMYWERGFVKLMHVKPVDSANTLLQLRVTEYRGKQTLLLTDGEQIQQGDQIAELHLDNHLLYQLGATSSSSVHLAIQLVRRTELLMPQIISLLQTDPAYKNVKGLYGISIIHRGTKKLGFTVLDLPKGIFSHMTRLYLRFLLYVVHPRGKDRMKEKSELLVPKIIAISRKELMNRYVARAVERCVSYAEVPQPLDPYGKLR
ncbi:Peptidoglycan/xylan/chitin deacetylase, PgdA/CDA1 family [Paenibacillus sp. UNCCL117]|uniref:polysaccharide deacetylase family protein n=1 Tax=unclassified Paenibacillus TaxID=185978 RepID=UPI00087F43F9|nr:MULTISPECIES: polysaccharide deacetylase family protein [unclassified Paenibacillus]SDC05932.1 Peptidoglycan/xylan/chitin deacetylase, PgdA/CDA1 family [Paenibacillus sp. cl123]SFW37685.1 Peptidoglycan/xylan/chitin deacetylase, PgdA/CDA1 family [Paenibacillus sp. UNCCL117]